MSTRAQSLINRWGIKKYKLDLNAEVRLEMETSRTGCPTCGGSQEAVITVYCRLPGRKDRYLESHYDFHTLMNEILKGDEE